MRHCWFTRTLCCPLRSPRSFSNRLPGGTLRSSRTSAASRISNFRNAARWVLKSSLLERSRRQTRSVSLSANDLNTVANITRGVNNVKRYRGAQTWLDEPVADVRSGASITYLADLAAFTQELAERGGFCLRCCSTGTGLMCTGAVVFWRPVIATPL